jgi:hypothetical protein
LNHPETTVYTFYVRLFLAVSTRSKNQGRVKYPSLSQRFPHKSLFSMRTLFILIALCCGFSLSAQIGVIANANFNDTRSTYLDGVVGANPLELENGWEVGLNYWFRLPQKRVEFMPTIYFANTEFTGDRDDGYQGFSEVGVQFKVNVYPFDFGGDCDCPTFGKQGPQLQKGFFLQVSPGYALYMPEDSFVEYENKSGFTMGVAVGLDIGLSNLVTITPVAGIRYGFSPYAEVFYADMNGQPEGIDDPSLTTFQAGLQVSFRFDHRKF